MAKLLMTARVCGWPSLATINYTSDSETDDEPLPYEPDYVLNFEFDSTESYVEFCVDGF